MNQKAVVLFLLFSLSTTFAWAFETWPEYQSLNRREAAARNGSDFSDSEYSSDVLTFSRSFRWDYDRISSPNSVSINAGSISGKEFYLDNSVRIQQKLSDRLDFRFTYAEQGDYDRELQFSVLELNYWLSQRSGVALYGQPFFDKSGNDFGVAYLFRPLPFHEIRVFYSWVDFVRNDRNRGRDQFLTEPNSYGLVARVWSPRGGETQEFTEIAIRQEDRSSWSFPDDNRRFDFARTYWSVKRRRRVREFTYMNWGALYTRRLEREEFSSGPGTSGFTESEHWQVMPQLERMVGSDRWTFGAQYADRFWRSEGGNVRQQTWSPHVWWEQPVAWTDGRDLWMNAIEASFYQSRGPRAARISTDLNNAVEYRWNTIYDFGFQNGGRLRLHFTFDLDQLFSDVLWEGGGAQFILPF